KGQLAKLVARIDRFAIDCDNIRIYKIRGVAAVTFYGRGRLVSAEEFVFF
ncbi:CRISPR-associated endonuclease Cas2, partial [Mycobacterium tuberculosis]